MSIEVTSGKKLMSKGGKCFYYLSAVLLPSIFLFVLYNGNYEDSHILFSHVLILTFGFAWVSAVGLLLLRLIVRNYEGALLVLLLTWSLFWLFEAIYASQSMVSKNVLLVMIIGLIFCVMIALRFISANFYKVRLIFNMLAGMVCLLFIFNFFPAVLANLRETPEVGIEQADFYIMKEFDIDSNLPSPDIYWFHLDGMINLADMEYFLDESQDELRQQLIERGFVINEEATLGAHNTIFSVPALMSPAFYDSYLGTLLEQTSGKLRRERHRALHGAFERDGISLADDIAPYHELFNAFSQADYTVISIADFDERVAVPLDHFYRLGNGERADREPFTVGNILEVAPHPLRDALDLVELLTLTTPIPYRIVIQIREGIFDWESIPTYREEIDHLTADTRNLHHERQLYRALIDSFTVEGPKLTHMTLMFTHAARWHWQHHPQGETLPHRIDLYPAARRYALDVTFQMIDMILEQNPNAVIVLQSDHGFHLHGTQSQLMADGLTAEEVAHLQNSVMSAVRIPEQYGGLVEPLDPRNITRELVNRFVGQNYQLLTE